MTAPAPKDFHGIDWHTTRQPLARVLSTLDNMQSLVLGFLSDLSLSGAEQLKMLLEFSYDARLELDFLAADTLGGGEGSNSKADLQTAWSFVEAEELLAAIQHLAEEARTAMRHQHLDDMPDTVTLDLAENLRRVKLLLASIDDVPAVALARA